ncbi:hypothetical protein Patl1_05958 [Pistacia atlantica]|uniref:Uncharacterized protein n=1 Tax=Pistacia atlantica TaxID=434234 RepID=A0ACC1BVT6_9ROSI|nr:hypothetical protein Patl1_05958 [Pistacia atlantica]
MGDEKLLLPTWFLLMTNIFNLMQLVVITLIYLQPTNEVFENGLQIQRWINSPGLMYKADIQDTLCDRCIPLDFILPMVFYIMTFKPSKQSITFWGKKLIAVVFSGIDYPEEFDAGIFVPASICDYIDIYTDMAECAADKVPPVAYTNEDSDVDGVAHLELLAADIDSIAEIQVKEARFHYEPMQPTILSGVSLTFAST